MAVWLMAGAHAAQASASRHASHVADEFLQPGLSNVGWTDPGKGTPPRLYFTYLGHAGWDKPIGL